MGESHGTISLRSPRLPGRFVLEYHREGERSPKFCSVTIAVGPGIGVRPSSIDRKANRVSFSFEQWFGRPLDDASVGIYSDETDPSEASKMAAMRVAYDAEGRCYSPVAFDLPYIPSRGEARLFVHSGSESVVVGRHAI